MLQQGWTLKTASEINQSQRQMLPISPLCEVPGVVRFRESGSRKVVARGWGEGRMGSYGLIDRVSVLQDERRSGDRW